MKKILAYFLLAVFCLILGFLAFIGGYFYHSRPKLKGKITVNGLTNQVKIIIDSWGVPHIYAQNEKDLFFACGYIQASERMWQMELIRRAGLGQLSEIFGRRTLEEDKIMRNLGLKEAALRDFEKLTPQMKDLLLAYCHGVNFWLNSRRLNWPPEFLLLRYRPRSWTAIDSLIVKEMMAYLLCTDFQSEIIRARLLKKLGAERASQILEEGLKIPQDVRDISYSEAEGLAAAGHGASNNWVLAGKRSESGKPLLANDPHLPISLPPIWYELHLHCPTMNVIGVSLPGIPLVIIGHNKYIAWGITSSTVDVQDLYLEKLDRSQDMYLDSDSWKPLHKREEIIKVKGQQKPERMEIVWTSRGPIISPVIIKSEQPVSLRWTIYEGGRSFEAFYLLNKAQNWPQFLQGLKLFEAPSQNFVYADKRGNIGYYLSGKIPLRPQKAALFPFPGWEKEGNWHGFLKEEDKPTIFNPSEGFIVTANNKIVPDDYPFYLSFDWDVPFRAERIKELLLQRKKHNLQSLKAIQNDVFSKKAELIVPLLRNIGQEKGDLSLALRMIKQWNLKMDQGGAPALYEVFMDFLHAQVFKDELGQDYEKFDTYFRHKKAGLLRILDESSFPWFDNQETEKIETMNDILKLSLDKAYKWLKKKYGPQPNWEWTKLHALRLRHVLGEMPFFWFLNAGSHPLNGDAYTVRATFSISSGYKTTHGPSYRQIVDLSHWENSLWIITSGQSGHFLSPYYKDQLPLWLKGDYRPMLFSNKSIEAKARGVLWLKPLKN